jgi:hypothetical protein
LQYAAQLVAAAHLVIDRDLPARHAVVRQLRVDAGEIRAEEAHFLQRVIADREDVVAEARRLDQRVLVVAGLIAEDVLDVMPAAIAARITL